MKIKANVPQIRGKIRQYVYDNIKEYALVTILFIIGIFVGVIVVNNLDDVKTQEIKIYITDFIEKYKTIEKLDKVSLIGTSIKNNIILTIIIWIAGTTVIGVPIVLAVILFRGVCLGYTISSITYSIGLGKGILFCIVALCLQNILFIPAILSLGVSSLKLYKSIIKDRRRENIKIEIIRHTIFSLLMLAVLILSSFIENTISISILQKIIKFF